jgi:hypothetical protein
LCSGPSGAEYEYGDWGLADLIRIPFHIYARAPILPLRAAPAKALFCPYRSSSRASMVSQDAASRGITCHDPTYTYCTYGKRIAHNDPLPTFIPRGKLLLAVRECRLQQALVRPWRCVDLQPLRRLSASDGVGSHSGFALPYVNRRQDRALLPVVQGVDSPHCSGNA